MRQRWQRGDILELDDGADLQDSLGSGTNMVIQMGQVWTNNIQIAKFCQTQGVVQKTMTGKSSSSRQGGGGGVSEDQKDKPVPTKSDFLATIQNHSRTPKACFTLGLESFGHIYSYLNSFESGTLEAIEK